MDLVRSNEAGDPLAGVALAYQERPSPSFGQAGTYQWSLHNTI